MKNRILLSVFLIIFLTTGCAKVTDIAQDYALTPEVTNTSSSIVENSSSLESDNPLPTESLPTSTPTQVVIPEYDNLELNSQYASDTETQILIGGVFAVIWPTNFDYSIEAANILKLLNETRTAALQLYGLQDPSILQDGYYVNVYLLHYRVPWQSEDYFPGSIWPGINPADDGAPYIAYADYEFHDEARLYKIAFELFTFNSPIGWEQSNTTQWFHAAVTEWYAYSMNRLTNENTISPLVRLPQAALWKSSEPQQEMTWERENRKHSLFSLFTYLVDVEKVSPYSFTSGYFNSPVYNPLEYLTEEIHELPSYLANWAAHNAAGFEYLGFENLSHLPETAVFYSEGTSGEWFTPSANLLPRGWGYNVLKVAPKLGETTWKIDFQADDKGSTGADSKFQIRIVTKHFDGSISFSTLPLTDGLTGTYELTTSSEVSVFNIVVVAVPEQYTSTQYYPYNIKIEKIAFKSESNIISSQTQQPSLPSYGPLALQTQYGSVDENDVLTDDIFAVWWDNRYDLSADARDMLDVLKEIRQELVLEFGMQDPPNPTAGKYVNIYIHQSTPGYDNYPDDFAIYVSTDSYSLPFMALERGYHNDPDYLYHESIHLFQNSATGPFTQSDEAAWYIETSANWYAADKYSTRDNTYGQAGFIYAIPYEPLWYTQYIHGNDEPDNWQRSVRHYAFHTFLRYLELDGAVSPKTFLEGYYTANLLLPQEYLYQTIENLKIHFGNWAAHNAADFDYLSETQVNNMYKAVAEWPDQSDVIPYVAQLDINGTHDEWFIPDSNLLPGGWSYNIIKVDTNLQSGIWHIDFIGEEKGSEGQLARFEVRVVTRQSNGTHNFYIVPINEFLSGNFSIETNNNTQLFYVIVAAVPEHFSGLQQYSYAIKIRLNSE